MLTLLMIQSDMKPYVSRNLDTMDRVHTAELNILHEQCTIHAFTVQDISLNLFS